MNKEITNNLMNHFIQIDRWNRFNNLYSLDSENMLFNGYFIAA